MALVKPPSAAIRMPLMNALARSRGKPRDGDLLRAAEAARGSRCSRPPGSPRLLFPRLGQCLGPAAKRAVSVAPGRPRLDVIPSGPSSRARVFEKPATAARRRVRQNHAIQGSRTVTEARCTIRPQRARRMTGDHRPAQAHDRQQASDPPRRATPRSIRVARLRPGAACVRDEDATRPKWLAHAEPMSRSPRHA